MSAKKPKLEPVPCYECGHEVTKSTITCPKCAVFSPGEAKPSPAKLIAYDKILHVRECPHCGQRGHTETKRVCPKCKQRLPLWSKERFRMQAEKRESESKAARHNLYAGLGIVFVIWLILCYVTWDYSPAIFWIGIIIGGTCAFIEFADLYPEDKRTSHEKARDERQKERNRRRNMY